MSEYAFAGLRKCSWLWKSAASGPVSGSQSVALDFLALLHIAKILSGVSVRGKRLRCAIWRTWPDAMQGGEAGVFGGHYPRLQRPAKLYKLLLRGLLVMHMADEAEMCATTNLFQGLKEAGLFLRYRLSPEFLNLSHRASNAAHVDTFVWRAGSGKAGGNESSPESSPKRAGV